MSTASPGARLRALLDGGAHLVPGAFNALTAKLIERTGFSALFLTGAGVANAYLGVPDLGLLTLTELADHARQIVRSVQIPVIVDADTGFGNPIGVQRTVQELEGLGAAGLTLEDQAFPKRCGHFAGKEIIPAAQMVQKIRAAVDARKDPDFVLVARTDAFAVEGLEGALERARLYREAGADVTFVEAPTGLEDIRRIGGLGWPQLINMVEGGKTPITPREQLQELGISLVLYANAALRAAIKAEEAVLQSLAKDGTTLNALDQMATWEVRQGLVGHPEFQALEQKYAAETPSGKGPK